VSVHARLGPPRFACAEIAHIAAHTEQHLPGVLFVVLHWLISLLKTLLLIQ